MVKKLSLVIPCKDRSDPKLKTLLRSIETQGFPKEDLEVLVITDGTSESAKAIGIKQAQGEIICFLASDNVIETSYFLEEGYRFALKYGAMYHGYYHHDTKDDILNRYFALIGGNDPLAYYLNKNDHAPVNEPCVIDAHGKTIGDNGFFVRRSLIASTDLDHYYHIDNANEACATKHIEVLPYYGLKHDTGGNLFKFLAKRYKYGAQHAFSKDRRWHLVTKEDITRLIWFVLCSITLVEPLLTSIRGYLSVRDKAWFIHPIVCLGIVFVYGWLLLNLCIRRLSQLLYAH